MTEPQTEPITDMNSEDQLPLPKMLVLFLLAIPLVIAWAAFLAWPDALGPQFGAIFITAVFVFAVLFRDQRKNPQVADMDEKGLAIVDFKGRRTDLRWEEITELRCRHNLGRRQGLDGYIRLRTGKNKVEINNSFPALDRMVDFAARACRKKGVSFVDESPPAAISDEHHLPPRECPWWALLVVVCLPFLGIVLVAGWYGLLATPFFIGLAALFNWAHSRDYKSATHPLALRTIEVNEAGISATTCDMTELHADWSDVISTTVDLDNGQVLVYAKTADFEIFFHRFKKSPEIADVVTDYCLKKGIRLDHERYGKFNYAG